MLISVQFYTFSAQFLNSPESIERLSKLSVIVLWELELLSIDTKNANNGSETFLLKILEG